MENELTQEQLNEMRRERQRKARRDWYHRNKDKVSEKYYKSKADEYLKKHERIMKIIGGVAS